MHKARGMSGSAIEEKQNTPNERCPVKLATLFLIPAFPLHGSGLKKFCSLLLELLNISHAIPIFWIEG
jgi:hypothetical protein